MGPDRCFCRRGEGRSFHVEGPKTEKAREPTVEIESGARNLEAESARSRAESTGRCVNEDSHRDQAEQRAWHIYSRWCLFCTGF